MLFLKIWWSGKPEVDQEIKNKFTETLKLAETGQLNNWEKESKHYISSIYIIKRLFHYLNITHFFQLLVQTKSYVSQTDQFYANLVCLNLSMKQHSFFILILSPIKH